MSSTAVRQLAVALASSFAFRYPYLLSIAIYSGAPRNLPGVFRPHPRLYKNYFFLRIGDFNPKSNPVPFPGLGTS